MNTHQRLDSMGPESVLAVIPARLGSSRLPEKPLADILGKPMIAWVYEAVSRARGLAAVVVATDSDRIARAVEDFGGLAVMTRPDHPSGSDRIAEVARNTAASVILNVQGDEPLMDPSILEALVTGFLACPHPVGTLVTRSTSPADLADPARVKVVRRADGRALYFSRSAVPFDRDGIWPGPWWLHVGVYIYRREFLLQMAGSNPSPLESCERLEQLRVLETGHEILTVPVAFDGHAVDTPADLTAVRERLSAARKTD